MIPFWRLHSNFWDKCICREITNHCEKKNKIRFSLSYSMNVFILYLFSLNAHWEEQSCCILGLLNINSCKDKPDLSTTSLLTLLWPPSAHPAQWLYSLGLQTPMGLHCPLLHSVPQAHIWKAYIYLPLDSPEIKFGPDDFPLTSRNSWRLAYFS